MYNLFIKNNNKYNKNGIGILKFREQLNNYQSKAGIRTT